MGIALRPWEVAAIRSIDMAVLHSEGGDRPKPKTAAEIAAEFRAMKRG